MINLKTFKKNIFALNERKPVQLNPKLIPTWFRKASVLVLFWETGQSIKVVLTKRSPKISKHKGEVCFPGGKIENGETFKQAALREAEEEIGIDKSKVEINGCLDDTWSGAAFHLAPVVGWYQGIPSFKRNVNEVEKILVFDVLELLQDAEHKTETIESHGKTYEFSTIKCSVGTVFGLSADLLLEALEYGVGTNTQRGIKREKQLQNALKTGFFENKEDFSITSMKTASPFQSKKPS